MNGEKFKITVDKRYRVFELAISSDEPMDEPNEQQLYAWLRVRDFSDEEAAEIIQQVNEKGEYTITLP